MRQQPRYSGILLHPSSLPSEGGIGDFGESAFKFVDFLHKANVGLWQILPLGPIGFGNSPYASKSAFAGSELFISLELLAQEGLLNTQEIIYSDKDPAFVDYESVSSFKLPLIEQAGRTFLQKGSTSRLKEFDSFCEQESYWLHDWALYRAMERHYNDSRWYEKWDNALAQREEKALLYWSEQKKEEIELYKVLQFFFYEQWLEIKKYAHSKGVALVGDIPIFVAHDSVDVWAHRHYFKVDSDGSLKGQAGVPPDAFSSTGQLWGNPLYDWDALKKDDYSWWVRRLEHQFKQTTMLRIDHFRGFEAYWEVPSTHKTAEKGKWIKGPGNHFFEVMRKKIPHFHVIAEDLGVITDEVKELRDNNHLPGMKIIQFAFDYKGPGKLDPNNPYLPHNYPFDSVAYTGTHDNDTTVGWYSSLGDEMKDLIRRYFSCGDDQAVWQLIRSVLSSVAQYAIVPMQDLLFLDSHARMNTPGTCGDPNWCWRALKEHLNSDVAETMRQMSLLFGRDGTIEDLLHL
jgi:4-alpha-glucanotransferase